MVWAVVSWGIRRVCSPVYGLPWGRRPACLVRGGAIGTCSPGPCVGLAGRFGGLCAGQFTAERVKTRMAAAVVRIAQPARTSRLRAASVVVLVSPQMSCSPPPVRSSTP